jgi:hypothetical protein
MNQQPFTIAEDGDGFEKRWWPQWTSDSFPSYEVFWAARIAPLTYRVQDRRNVHFRTSAELAADGYTDEDVAVAQLHYTLLRHLGRVYELLMVDDTFGRNEFFESFTRLSGASDVADELLARRESPGTYTAWDERQGQDARTAWRRGHPNDPLRPIRGYRNRLVHGRVVPELSVTMNDREGNPVGDVTLSPRLERVDAYLDWRVAFAGANFGDFAQVALIAGGAWELAVEYVEQTWRTHLLPNL